MYHPGETIQPSPINDESNLKPNIYIYPGKQHNHSLFMIRETWNEICVYHPGDTTQPYPLFMMRVIWNEIYVYHPGNTAQPSPIND